MHPTTPRLRRTLPTSPKAMLGTAGRHVLRSFSEEGTERDPDVSEEVSIRVKTDKTFNKKSNTYHVYICSTALRNIAKL